jgi:hypothetical protein
MAFDLALICHVKVLDRETAPLFGLFLASLAISNAIPIKSTGSDPGAASALPELRRRPVSLFEHRIFPKNGFA